MKKKILVLLIVALVIITGCGKEEKKEIPDNEKELLIVYSKYNFKSAATLDGIAIFEDGTIYTEYYSALRKEYNSDIGSYSINTINGSKQLYLDKGKKQEKKVSNEDIKKIKSIISKLNMQDTGCHNDEDVYSNIIVNKDNESLKYITSGKCDVTGNNKDVKELLSIVEKYK